MANPSAASLRACPGARRFWSPGRPGLSVAGLSQALTGAGHHVIALVRNPAKADALHPPITLITKLDQVADDAKIDAIVNLAGEPIGNGLWTEAKRRKIVDSRIGMTNDVVRLIGRLERRPGVLVSGSAIGWYGLWQDQPLTESAKAHGCFSHELCEPGRNKPAARPNMVSGLSTCGPVWWSGPREDFSRGC